MRTANRGFTAQQATGVREGDESAIDPGQVRHRGAPGHKDAEGWGRVGGDRRRHSAGRGGKARAACRVGLAQREADRQIGGAGVGAGGDLGGDLRRDAEIDRRDREITRPGRARDIDKAGVAARRQRNDVGDRVVDPERLRVLIPVSVATGLALAQEKVKTMSVGANAAVGVRAMTKLCAAPWAMSAGVLGVPVSVLVFGLVV